MSSEFRPPALLDDALGFNLDRVAKLFRRELVRALAEHGLSPEQWQTLAVLLLRGQPLSQREICALTLRDKPAVSRMVARMERDGWVRRAPD